VVSYAFVWMAVTPGLGFWRAMVMTQAATAVTNTVPTVGPAIGAGLPHTMFRSWGFGVADLGGGGGLRVWNTFVKLDLPVLALALVLLQGGAGSYCPGTATTLVLVASASQYSAELGGSRWREIMAGWIFPNGRMAGRRLHLWLQRLPAGSSPCEDEG
jgi:hypothetical protein